MSEPVNFLDDSDAPKWQAIFWVGGHSFDAVKSAMNVLASQVVAAKTWQSLPSAQSTGDGFRTLQAWSCKYRSPIEAQIKELRARADELERSLNG